MSTKHTKNTKRMYPNEQSVHPIGELLDCSKARVFSVFSAVRGFNCLFSVYRIDH